jgi:DNA-binding HxlR family transcriptional regulator
VLDAGPRSATSPIGVRETSEAENAARHQFRAGGYVLSLFSKALHGLVLHALADGPLRLADLRRKVGGPAQSTLRGNLDNLIEMGALEKRQGNGNGRANMVDNALTPLGAELLSIADAVESWLARAPDGTLHLESEMGKATIKALVSGWDSTMLRALAVRPFSLTELDNLISAHSYPALERRLAAMRLVGFLSPAQRNGGATPYAVADWLRQAMAPLLAAIRCERRHLGAETAPLTRLDIETILLLGVPLAELSPSASGISQLAVSGGDDSDWRSAGVRLSVESGRIVSCTSKLEAGPDNWIRGSAIDWLEALVCGDSERLEVGGDRAITLNVVDSLHRRLFAAS